MQRVVLKFEFVVYQQTFTYLQERRRLGDGILKETDAELHWVFVGDERIQNP